MPATPRRCSSSAGRTPSSGLLGRSAPICLARAPTWWPALPPVQAVRPRSRPASSSRRASACQASGRGSIPPIQTCPGAREGLLVLAAICRPLARRHGRPTSLGLAGTRRRMCFGSRGPSTPDLSHSVCGRFVKPTGSMHEVAQALRERIERCTAGATAAPRRAGHADVLPDKDADAVATARAPLLGMERKRLESAARKAYATNL